MIMATPAPTSAVDPAASRITVIERVYHQVRGEQPKGFETTFVLPTLGDDEPYSRKVKIVGQWTPLDLGWITRARMMILRNDEGKFPHRVPSPAERELASRKVVQVSFDGETPALDVHPTETARFSPSDLTRVWLRCLDGMAHGVVQLYPW